MSRLLSCPSTREKKKSHSDDVAEPPNVTSAETGFRRSNSTRTSPDVPSTAICRASRTKAVHYPPVLLELASIFQSRAGFPGIGRDSMIVDASALSNYLCAFTCRHQDQ